MRRASRSSRIRRAVAGSRISSTTCARSTSPRSRTCSTRATTARTAARPGGARVPAASTRPSGAASWSRWARTWAPSRSAGWTHTIPEYFDFDRFWARLSGRRAAGRRRTRACGAHAAHHRAPRARLGHAPSLPDQLAGHRSPKGRGNPAGAHPFKAYNVLLMHNGEQVGVDSTSPFLERVRLRARRCLDGPGRRATTTAIRSTSARRSPTPSTPRTWSTSRAACSGSPPRRRARSSRRSPASTSRQMDAARRESCALLMTELRAAHADRPVQVHHRRIATLAARRRRRARASASARTWTSSSCARTRSSCSDVRHRPESGARAGGGQRQRGQDRRQHAARAAPAGRARRRRRPTCASACGPGGNPARREFGGVFEAFTASAAAATMELRNRFGEAVAVERAGTKVDLSRAARARDRRADPAWRGAGRPSALEQLARALEGAPRDAAARVRTR